MTIAAMYSALSVSWQQQIAKGFAVSHWLRPASSSYVELLDSNGSNSLGLSVGFEGTFNYHEFITDGVPLEGVINKIRIREATFPNEPVVTIYRLHGLQIELGELEAAMAGAGLAVGETPTRKNAQAFFDLLDGNVTNVYGTESDDVLEGGKGKDRLNGLGGDDLILASNSLDTINGGDGSDTISFEGMRNKVKADLDLRYGAAAIVKEDAFGQEVLTRIASLKFVENAIGTRMGDEIFGRDGRNRIDGAGGDDELYGYLGRDTLIGGAGRDKLWGGKHNDVLTGGTGWDKLWGGKGDDSLEGGVGRDRLTGGAGEDQFIFSRADVGTMDRVTDFELGIDTVVVSEAPQTIALQNQGDDLRLTVQFDATTAVNVLLLDAAGASLSDLGL